MNVSSEFNKKGGELYMKDKSSCNIKQFFISNSLTIILGTPTIFAFIQAVFNKIKNQTEWSQLEIIMVIIYVVIVAVFASYIIWRSLSYRSYYYPTGKIKVNYSFDEKSISYIRNSQNELCYSKKYIIKSSVNNLESICDRYIWTGNSKPGIPQPTKNIRCISEENNIGIWTYIRIVLDKSLKKNKDEIIEFRMPPISRCDSSSPFVSVDTDVPTKAIVINVNLGDEYKGAELICEEFRSIDSDFPLLSQREKFDSHGCYVWKISAKRYRYYRIRWSWNTHDVPNIPSSQGGK